MKYTVEKNLRIIIALLKAHGIKKVIASPGTTNMSLVASMQNDPWFEMYSCVDERGAAYMGCGLAAESGEPIVITCTEATSARNYMPGLTEAFYRKLPVLAITTTHGAYQVGNLLPQVLDHSVQPNDIALKRYFLPLCESDRDVENATLKVNDAILELSHRGGGPVFMNVETSASRKYVDTPLPSVRMIERFTLEDNLPQLPQGRIGVFTGSHKIWSEQQINAVENFCAKNNAVVFCDVTSNYTGKYRVNYSLIACQKNYLSPLKKLDLVISIGELTGDYFGMGVVSMAKEMWRVSEDGAIRDHWRKLHYVFEMSEKAFFEHYSEGKSDVAEHIIKQYDEETTDFHGNAPELKFTKPWAAQQLMELIPSQSYVHFSILGAFRAGNFFNQRSDLFGSCNVGGFGIDGATSTFIGASLAHKDKLHFLFTGDLAFFYDLNAIGNRHVGRNVRILLVSNGDGTEFRQRFNQGYDFTKEYTDKYIAAGGHFGKQSPDFVRHMAEDLGFEYLSATNKETFCNAIKRFTTEEMTDRPMFMEIFTYSEDDSEAVEMLRTMRQNNGQSIKAAKDKVGNVVKTLLGERGTQAIKNVLKK